MPERRCLGCGEPFDYADRVCPACDWDVTAFRERGRHGLEKDGHGEPESKEERSGSGGPPPGPGGLLGI